MDPLDITEAAPWAVERYSAFEELDAEALEEPLARFHISATAARRIIAEQGEDAVRWFLALLTLKDNLTEGIARALYKRLRDGEIKWPAGFPRFLPGIHAGKGAPRERIDEEAPERRHEDPALAPPAEPTRRFPSAEKVWVQEHGEKGLTLVSDPGPHDRKAEPGEDERLLREGYVRVLQDGRWERIVPEAVAKGPRLVILNGTH
jgi:hypothetical protein